MPASGPQDPIPPAEQAAGLRNPAAVFMMDPQGRITSWSRGVREVLGWEEGEWLRQSHACTFTPEEAAEADLELAAARRTHHVEAQRRLVRRDGSRFFAHSLTIALNGPKGELQGFVRVVQDLAGLQQHGEETERLRDELTRRAAEFEALLAVIPVGIGIAYDPDCRHIRVNPALAAALGISIGQNASKTAPDGSRPLNFRVEDDSGREIAGEQLPMQLAAREGRKLDGMEINIVREDGRLIRLLEYAAPLFDADGAPRGSVGAFVDITDRKWSEQRNQFLVQLDDVLRPLTEPEAITAASARLLGEHLRVSRCAYAEIEADQDSMLITGNYTRGVPSIVGRLKFSDFGDEVLRLMRENRPYVVHDVDHQEPAIRDATAYRNTRIQSVICVPLHKEGRLVAAMAVHEPVPRRWHAHEVELVQTVADRCWESFERARVARDLVKRSRFLKVLADNAVRLLAEERPAAMIETLFEEVSRLLELELCFHFLVTEDRRRLRLSVCRGVGEAVCRQLEYLEVGQAVCGMVAQTREGIALTDVQRSDSASTAWIRSMGVQTYACFPLIADQQLIGTLSFGSREQRTLEERELSTLRAISDQVATALARGRTAERLRASEERFRQLANTIPQLVWVANADGWITWYNDRWYEYTGTSPREMEGWGWQSVHDPTWLPRVLEAWNRSIVTGEPFDLEFPIRGADGTFRPFLTRVMPLRDAAGRVIQWFGTNTDVTEHRRLAEERRQLLDAERHARTEAERVSQMKDEFLATLSHELRTPLSAILGWSQLLEGSRRDPQMLQEGLSAIARNARAQTRLIEDLLDMSRIISGKLRLDVQQVDPAQPIEAALQAMLPAAQAKELRIEKVLDPQAGPIAGDASRLQQIVWNLLTNAVRFTPRGGRIQVVLQRGESHVEIRVSDTGKGIRPDFLPLVFDRFRQADASTTRQHGGLGLGLALVRQLTEMHGGTVRAMSPGEGKGATFVVSFPVPLAKVHDPGEGPPASGHDAVPPELTHDLSGVRVLVVDDDPDAQVLARRILEERGAEVFTAGAAEQALEILERHRPHIIISDIGMPNHDGYELIRQVRSLAPERGGQTPAAALTAFARSEDRRRALIAGYQSHVAKPVDPSELIAAVASLAGRTGLPGIHPPPAR